jgi:hypothetical protein
MELWVDRQVCRLLSNEILSVCDFLIFVQMDNSVDWHTIRLHHFRPSRTSTQACNVSPNTHTTTFQCEDVGLSVSTCEELRPLKTLQEAISSDFIWENNNHPDMSCVIMQVWNEICFHFILILSFHTNIRHSPYSCYVLNFINIFYWSTS